MSFGNYCIKNKIIVVMVVIFALFVGATSVFAKRLAPTPVNDVVFNGIKYSASNVEMGYVEARDIQNNTLIWKKEVYKVTYDNNLEKDVQDVFVTHLQIEDNNLLVTNEKGEIYKIDLKTGKNAINKENVNENKGEKENNKGRINSEAHRSMVANFVQSLLSVANSEGGIGQQVRVIAQQQNDSKEKTAEAIDKIEKRSKIKTFLLGTDYKNIGALRSEMVKTRNDIEQLKRLTDKAKNEQNKSELQTQIQNLEQEQTDIDSFISNNENEFNLFGWAVKLFVK